MRPGCSAGDSNGPVPVPLSRDAAVVGAGSRGEIMSGAPKGVAGVLRGVPNPGIAGDSNRCDSAAAASLLHSSSHAGNHQQNASVQTADGPNRPVRRRPRPPPGCAPRVTYAPFETQNQNC